MPRPSDATTRGARPRLSTLTRHPLARALGGLAAVLLFSAIGARSARLSHADAPLPDPMPPIQGPAPALLDGSAPDGGANAHEAAGDVVFVNRATVDELRRLPGVGPKRAGAIVALRDRLGGFRRAEDLLRVRGVGRKTLARWRPRLRFDRAAPDGGAPDGGVQDGGVSPRRP